MLVLKPKMSRLNDIYEQAFKRRKKENDFDGRVKKATKQNSSSNSAHSNSHTKASTAAAAAGAAAAAMEHNDPALSSNNSRSNTSASAQQQLSSAATINAPGDRPKMKTNAPGAAQMKGRKKIAPGRSLR